MYSLSDCFACASLPSSFLERYRSADGPALKVAIFMLCGNCATVGDIASELCMSEQTASRAVDFWEKAGLIKDSAKSFSPAENSVQKQRPIIEPRKHLSSERAAELSLYNPDIAVLMQETQRLIARPLDAAESRTLLEVVEFEGYTADMILTVISFFLPRIKNRRSVIAKSASAAQQWRELGIDSADALDKHINLLELREKRECKVAQALCLEKSDFNKAQKATIAIWYEEYGYDEAFVNEAFMRTGKDSVAYINSVLRGWHNKGYKSLRDTRDEISNAPAQSPKPRVKAEKSIFERAIKKASEEQS